MLTGTLFRRLVLPLVGTVALVTVVATYVGATMMGNAVTDRVRRRARSLSVIERDSLLNLMQAGDHANLQPVLEQLGRHPDIEVVRILHPDGRVHASSRSFEVDRSIPEHLVQTSERGDLMEAGSPGTRRERIVHTVQPFRTTPSCRRCHEQAPPVLAWLDLDVEVNDHAVGLSALTRLTSWLGFFYLAAVAAIVVPTLGFVVKRPLFRLTRAMERVKGGDLTVSLERSGTSEVDAVIDGFNRMVGEMRAGRAAEEAVRRSQLERVEHLAVVGELAAGLVHEVRNPLSGVKAVLDVVTRESSDESRKHALRDAAGELNRIDQILKEFLQFARPRPPTLVPFDLSALVRDAATLTVPAGAGPNLRLQLAASLPAALGDPAQVRQVLVNLLVNAQHAASPQGVIVVSTGSGDGCVWCRVQDDGPGVSLDRAEAIFRPFVTSKTRGTGLGLSISRRIIELHGGRLILDNPGLPGATFTMTLPTPPASTAG